MGAIQSAINQTLGTAGTLAGLGKVVKSQEEATNIQRQAMEQAERRFTEEQRVKELKLEKMEQSGQTLLKPLERAAGTSDVAGMQVQNISPALARENVYVAEQLEKQYLDLGDIQKAAQFRQAQTNYSDLIVKQKQALAKAKAKKLAQQEQQKRSQEFMSMFTEGGRYK